MLGRILLSIMSVSLLLGAQFLGYDEPDQTQEDWAAVCEPWDEWNKPGPPFRIYGNTWYVGTCGIASILITSSDGHVLIDGGTARGADLIATNIERAGFDISDIKAILFSHEHDDHVGGLARLQQLSGALVLSSTRARAAMETGGVSHDDPQRGIAKGFAPVRVAGIAEDNMAVAVGTLEIIGWDTPGHTPGAMSWQWQASSSQENAPMTINYMDSLSPISADDYRFADHPSYVADFRRGLERMKHVGCGILVTPHPSASKLHQRIKAGGLEENRGDCMRYASEIEIRLNERLKRESGGDQ